MRCVQFRVGGVVPGRSWPFAVGLFVVFFVLYLIDG
jgi:hypothetical protein